MSATFYFTFGSDSPYRNCYVEIQVPSQTLIRGSGLDEHDPRRTAMTAMQHAHGGAWADCSTTRPPEGCARLALIVHTPDGRYAAADVMGDQL